MEVLSLFVNPFSENILNYLYLTVSDMSWKQVLAFLQFYALGFALLRIISSHFTVREQLGLSALLGMGMHTLLFFAWMVFLPDSLGFGSFFSSSLMLTLLLLGFAIKRKQLLLVFSKDKLKVSLQQKWRRLRAVNLVFLMALGLMLYCASGLFLKSIYWPVTDWDAITTFDFYARVIVEEKQLVNSVILDRRVMTGVAYPPMTTFSIAITYLAGFTSPKFVFPWLYFSFLLVFYCFSRRFVNATSAMVFTLLIIVTPELSAFSAFVKTNVIQTAMASGGILALLVWCRHREVRYLYVSALLLGLNAWTRSEGIEFIGVAMLLLLWWCLKHKALSGKMLGVYALISLLPFVLWQVYLSQTPDLSAYAAVSIIKTPFWDALRLGYILKALYQHAFHQQYFGLLFYAFVVAVALQLIIARNKVRKYLHVGVLLMLVLAHVVLLYQFAYSTDKEMLNLLNHSLKRYIFNWIPLSSFVIADSVAVRWIFDQLERFTSVSKVN